MTRKIELEYPYNERWRSGYLVTNKENRKTLILFNSCHDRSSTQYARYLLAVKLGRFLTNEETVDHIDNDKTNNSLDNLQILSRADNVRKECKKPDVRLVCPVCGKVFYKTATQLRGRKHKAERNQICCSRECGGKYKYLGL
jgi:hypothetical protein